METTAPSVKELAETIGIPVAKLLAQLKESGAGEKSPEDLISTEEKSSLLSHLRKIHGGADDDKPKRISLKRKVTTELDQPAGAKKSLGLKNSGSASRSGAGKGNKVKLVVRKKRTYVKRSELEAKELEAKELEAKELETKELETKELEAKELEAKEADVKAAEEELESSVDALGENKPVAAEENVEPVVEEAIGKNPASERATPPVFKGEVEAWPEKPTVRPIPEAPGRKKANPKFENRTVPQRKAKGKAGPVVLGAEAETKGKHGFEKPVGFQKKQVVVTEAMSVGELAAKMSVKAAEVIKVLMGMGQMVTINQKLDQDIGLLVVDELGHEGIAAEGENPETQLQTTVGLSEGTARAPVVTVMGHVDHGKTTLLDYIRQTRVASGEAGGITQHIGAYHVETDKGVITFLDTPGHAAFTAMRARGAALTDVIILVVAADDGVMPQTVEAIQHAKASGAPIIVAVNKIDKPGSDPDKVKQGLTAHEVISDDWGGENMFVNISAKTGEGVSALLDAISLQAEMLELKADASGQAKGIVVESRLDKGRGPVATVLIQSGTLHKGDVVLAGQEFGRARMLLDEAGKTLASVGPSMPVELHGLSGVPAVGDTFNVVEDEKQARAIAEYRLNKAKDATLVLHGTATGEDIFTRLRENQVKELNIILKADVHGSVDALADSLRKLATDEVAVKIVSSGVGGITETDVNLAVSSGSLIIGFNVRADATARRLIREKGVDLRYHSIIYEVLDEVKRALGGMLAPETRQEIIGLAQVNEVFRSRAFGAIAGCLVTEGSVRKNNPIRVLRGDVVIFEGELESLRRHKDDVNEVKSGTECGIGVKDYDDVAVGDQIECFEVITLERTL